MDECLALLARLGISYTRYDHAAVFTVADTNKHFLHMPGVHTKNLFLKNEAGTRWYLFVIEANKRADLRALAKFLGEKRLRFGSGDELHTHLNITPGSVSLLALMHDRNLAVRLLVDRDVWQSPVICCHPNVNTATLALARDDVARFFAHTGHTPSIVHA